jgi:MYXO-CTERM domain-containing protein
MLCFCSTSSAQNWAEGQGGWGEAGQNGVGAAQRTINGSGPDVPLTSITGNLSSRNDVDVFAVRISDETLFRASVTRFAAGTGFNDSELWLFNADGSLQVFNQDFPNGNGLSTITSQGVFNNGLCYIAICNFGTWALNPSGVNILPGSFWPGPDFGQFRGIPLDTPGYRDFYLASWDTRGAVGPGGDYTISLTGVTFADVPTPGVGAVLGLAGFAALRRRR